MLRPIVFTRIIFVLLATASGYLLEVWPAEKNATVAFLEPPGDSTIVAFTLAMLIVVFEYSLRTVSSKHLVLSAIGLLFGLVISALVTPTVPPDSLMDAYKFRIVCNLLFGYFGVVIALKHADQINLSSLRFMFANPDGAQSRLLDTSAIIDGRIQDLLLHGFLSGSIFCPSFVIDELQALADSADPLKRGKGRRGLQILKAIQDNFSGLQILEKDYPEIREVDRKLLELAKEINGQIITNDFNLQKVADIHNVSILNINELADFLKPSVFVGENFPLMIVREGKEQNQGVGYLPDGTMVVVDDGRQFVNTEIAVIVTSILQTNTGRMVFARPITRGHEQHTHVKENANQDPTSS